ncbi:MAG: hypothetical protein ACM3TT_10965 [Syntrophothermus sp.]
MASIPELLKDVLAEREYALLERLTRGWKDNPFHFDRESGRFELADDWLFRYGEALEEDYQDYGAKEDSAKEDSANEDSANEEPFDGRILDLEAGGEGALDLLLRSCELLSGKVKELDEELLGPGQRGKGETEEFSLSFTFDAGEQGSARSDLAVAERFIDLLSRDPVYRLSVADGRNAKVVRVSFHFRSDHEFFTRKNQVQWLLETARRVASDSPFGGTKL